MDEEFSFEQGEFFFENPPSAAPTAEFPRRFIGWERSLLDSLVDVLTANWTADSALDLSHILLVLPSQNSGRRLREALAIRAAESQSAVFPPLVVSPHYLYSPERLALTETPIASAAQTHWIWAALLLQLPLTQYRRLFPVDPVERNLQWACHAAKDFLSVRRLLAESGHSFSSAAEVFAQHDIEAQRWKELAALEQLAIQETSQGGLSDESEAQLRVPSHGALPSSVRQILVCGVADLTPLAERALAHYTTSHEVEILIAAPEEQAAHFDPLGRPLSDYWLEAPIPIPDPNHTIHQAATPREQTEKTIELILDATDSNDSVASRVAIGIPDASLSIPLQRTLEAHQIGSFDPSGTPLFTQGIYYLLKQTHELVASESTRAFRRLLNCPGVAEAIIKELPEGTQLTPIQLIRLMDDLMIETIPVRLSEATDAARRRFSQKHPELVAVIEWAKGWIRRFKTEPFDTTLFSWLAAIYEGRSFAKTDIQQAILLEVSSAVSTLESDLDFLSARFSKPPRGPEKLELLLTLLSQLSVYPDRGPDDVDLQGWLELLWEDAPHLIITGMNDDLVPETVVGHAFLPDTARKILGVIDNDQRFARDAYFLAAMLHSRNSPHHRIDFLFGRESATGDPLRPSRLLFQCPIEELPERTLQLFKTEKNQRATASRSIAFPLTPTPLEAENPIFHRLSPTAIKDYLACPYRFYLKHALKMEKVEINKREMNAADFGNLVHFALERLGTNDEARASSDADFIKTFLHDEVDQYLSFRYGNYLSTPLVIQREAARKRLAWWAQIEAEQRLAGWQIAEVESAFGTDEWPFILSGVTINGRIDRIDSHPNEGLRVVDFKTSAPKNGYRRLTAANAHLKPLKRSEAPEDFPDWMLIEPASGKLHRWVDLQLPLYLLAMRHRDGNSPSTTTHAAYGTLGATENEATLDPWPDLEESLLDSAQRCTEGVIEAIRSHQFWPPSLESKPWDPFTPLLGNDPEKAIGPIDSTGSSFSLNPVESA